MLGIIKGRNIMWGIINGRNIMNSQFRVLGAVTLFVVLTSATASATIISNGSFEDEPDGLMPNGYSTEGHANWGMPADWPWRSAGAANAHGIHRYDAVGWSSDGDWSIYMFASIASSHYKGDYVEFYQNVDLTGVTEIKFDVLLRGGEHTASYFAVGSDRLWVDSTPGVYYGQSVDVSSYTGLQEISFGVEVFEEFGPTLDGVTYFDNLRAVPEPGCLLLFVAAGFVAWRRR